MSRHRDWLAQSENDLEWAEHSFDGGFYAQTCFISQQAAEKALKALCYYRGLDVIKSHSLHVIVQALGVNDAIEKCANRLDLYYIPARYPDALPAGAPFEVFTKEQAEGAMRDAIAMIERVKDELDGG